MTEFSFIELYEKREIFKAHAFRLYEKMGIVEPDQKEIAILREEGRLKPISEFVSKGEAIALSLTANCTYLVEVK